MELAKAFLFRKICVPQPDDLINVELPCEVGRNPSVCEVHEDDVHRLQVLESLHINLGNHCLHLVEHFMHTRLHVREVVLNLIDEFAQAPEDISFSSQDAF